MKITVHELLGMIKDDKAPKKIKYDDRIWVKNSKNNDYTDSFGNEFFDFYSILVIIDDIVEILDKIEEKKLPEKLPIYDCTDAYSKFDINDNRKAINEIIDYFKSKEKGE